MRVTKEKNQKVTGPKIPIISNLKKPTCASKRDVLELVTLRYLYFAYHYKLMVITLDVHLLKKKVGKLKSKCLMILYDTISH